MGLRVVASCVSLVLFSLGFPVRQAPDQSQFGHFRKVQAATEVDLDAGSLLVADRQLRDPNFVQTVILLAKYEEEGSIGLILNRQTDVPVRRLFSDWKEARGRQEPVFIGGPVERSTVLGLIRSATDIEGAERVAGDLHLVTDRAGLQKSLSQRVPADRLRIYVGYAGWAADQLEAEIDAGAWHVFPGGPTNVFDPNPDTLWQRLIRQAETHIARSGPATMKSGL